MNDANKISAECPQSKEMIATILGHLSLDPADFPVVQVTGDQEFTSFYFCAPFHEHAFHFFSEMIGRQFGKKGPLSHLFCGRFRFAGSNQPYLAGVVTKKALWNGPESTFLEQLKQGLGSPTKAVTLLESCGLIKGEKELLIRSCLESLIQRRPQDFDYDLLGELQRFLLFAPESYKAERSVGHFARVIATVYLFRKAMEATLDAFPDRRYISVKVFRIEGGRRLALVIAISFLLEHELFELRHLQSAISAFLQGKIIQSTYIMTKSLSSSCRTFFCEIDAETPFSSEDAKNLKKHLMTNLTAHIEQRLSPLFMPPNEEELLRHMLTLSHELRYLRDIPQGMIIFKEQTDHRLEFYVILLRLVGTKNAPLMDLLKNHSLQMEFIFDRSKIMGQLRTQFKEATVLRVHLKKEPYLLRQDHSIDLPRARQEIRRELARLIGDFRDYNGGMMAKESGLLDALKEGLKERALENPFLLENFFYSLMPVVMRSVLPITPLLKLFHMVLDAEGEFSPEHEFLFQFEEDPCYAYFLLISTRASLKEEVLQAIGSLNLPPLDVASSFLKHQNHYSMGIIYHYPDPDKLQLLRLSLESSLTISA